MRNKNWFQRACNINITLFSLLIIFDLFFIIWSSNVWSKVIFGFLAGFSLGMIDSIYSSKRWSKSIDIWSELTKIVTKDFSKALKEIEELVNAKNENKVLKEIIKTMTNNKS